MKVTTMDEIISNTELLELIEFMESTAFRTRFLDKVHKISLGLRIAAINEHGASPCLQGDIASIEERIAWVLPYARNQLKKREEREKQELRNHNFGGTR